MLTLRFSWAAKLRALIVLIPALLGFIALLVMLGLHQISTTYQSVQKMSGFQINVTGLVADWALTDRQFQIAETADPELLESGLNKLVTDSRELVQRSKVLPEDSVSGASEEMYQAVVHYAALRRQWLDKTNLLLGEGKDPGLVSVLDEATFSLSDATMGMVGDAMRSLIDTQKAFLEFRNDETRKQAELAIEEFREVIFQYGWDESLAPEIQAYRSAFSAVVAAVDGTNQIERQVDVVAERFQALALSQQKTLREEVLPALLASASAIKTQSTSSIITAFLLLSLTVMLILFLMSRTLVRRIDSVSGLMAKVAEGDFSQKITVGRNPKDEFNRLGAAANRMISDIAEMVRQTLEGTRSLQRVKEDLESTMSTMSENNREVEKTTSEVVVSGQQIGMTLHEIAERTSNVGDSTQAVNKTVSSGADVVERSVTSTRNLAALIIEANEQVQTLAESNSRVTGILDMINGLSEQTNLLALNAAIEAARAGDAGRGFAVVAEEVRTLAQKTGNATQKICAIVDDLSRQCQSMQTLFSNGIELAKEGETSAGSIGGTMDSVTSSIATLTEEMDQVVVAVEEVTNAAASIGRQMEGMSKRNIETARIVDHMGGHSQRVVSVADDLSRLTGQFVI